MARKDKHAKQKALTTNLGIALNGYRHRVREEKQAIIKAKVNIKRYKLLAKQARNTYKLELLEEL